MAYLGREVKLFHNAVVRVVLLRMVALIEDKKIDLLHLHVMSSLKIEGADNDHN